MVLLLRIGSACFQDLARNQPFSGIENTRLRDNEVQQPLDLSLHLLLIRPLSVLLHIPLSVLHILPSPPSQPNRHLLCSSRILNPLKRYKKKANPSNLLGRKNHLTPEILKPRPVQRNLLIVSDKRMKDCFISGTLGPGEQLLNPTLLRVGRRTGGTVYQRYLDQICSVTTPEPLKMKYLRFSPV